MKRRTNLLPCTFNEYLRLTDTSSNDYSFEDVHIYRTRYYDIIEELRKSLPSRITAVVNLKIATGRTKAGIEQYAYGTGLIKKKNTHRRLKSG